MTSRFTIGGGEASQRRAVEMICGEIAPDYMFIPGLGVVPRPHPSRWGREEVQPDSTKPPRITDETSVAGVVGVRVEIGEGTTVEAGAVVASAMSYLATGRRPSL